MQYKDFHMSKDGDYPPGFVCGYGRKNSLPSMNSMEKGNPCFTSILSSPPDERHNRAIKPLKEAMLRLSVSRHPSLSHSQQEKLAKDIDACLSSSFPSQQCVPNHPPYAEMIRVSIRELQKKRGSSKESISSFIKLYYTDLPLAHEHLLTHHLEKLVKLGDIVSVTKSLYTLPSSSNASNENQLQEDQQLTVVREEVVVGKTGNSDVNCGALVAIPKKYPRTTLVEVVQPVAINDGLKSLPEKHSTAFIEMELMGGDDDVGDGLAHLAAVTEETHPLQNKLPLPENYPTMPVFEGMGTGDVDDGLMSLPEEHPTVFTKMEQMVGDDKVGHGSNHMVSATEEVHPLQIKLPLPEKCLTKPVVDRVEPVKVHDVLMPLRKKDPTVLIEPKLMGRDDVAGGSNQMAYVTEEEHYLQIKLPLPEKYPTIIVAEGIEPVDVNNGLMSLHDEHPTSLSTMERMVGDVGGGLNHMASANEEVYPLQIKLPLTEKCPTKSVVERVEPINIDDVLIPLPKKHPSMLTKMELMSSDDDIAGVSNHMAVTEEVHPLQIKLPLPETHPTIPVVEGIEPPMDVGDGIMSLPEKYPTVLTKMEQMGGGDDVGSGLNHTAAVTAEVQLFQIKLPLPEKYPTEPVVEGVEPVNVDDVLMSLPEKHPIPLVKMELVTGEDDVGDRPNHMTTLNEEVHPMQIKLPLLKKCPTKPVVEGVEPVNVDDNMMSILEKHSTVSEAMDPLQKELPVPKKNRTTPVLEGVEVVDIDDWLMSLSENHPTVLTEKESRGDDDGVGISSNHLAGVIEEIDPLQKELAEPGTNTTPPVAEELVSVNVDSGLNLLPEIYPVTLIEMGSTGNDGVAGRSNNFATLIEAVDPLQKKRPERTSKRKRNVKNLPKEVAKICETIYLAANNDPAVVNYSEEHSVCETDPITPVVKDAVPVKINNNLATLRDNQPNDGGGGYLELDTLQKKRLGRPPKRKRNVKVLEEKVAEVSETIPSTAIVALPANNDSAVGNPSQEQPVHETNPTTPVVKEAVPVKVDNSLATLPDNQPNDGGGGGDGSNYLAVDTLQKKRRGRPPKKENFKILEEKGIEISETIPSIAIVALPADDDSAVGNPSQEQPVCETNPTTPVVKEAVPVKVDNSLATLRGGGGSNCLVVDTLQKKRRGRPLKKKRNVKILEEKGAEISEIVPSIVIVGLPADNDPAVGNPSQQQRRLPAMKKCEVKQNQRIIKTDANATAVVEAVKPMQKKLPGRGRGRPPNKPNTRKT